MHLKKQKPKTKPKPSLSLLRHILRYLKDVYMTIELVTQRLERLPGMRETWVQSLGREDPLEEETATHSSTLAWRIPWTEEPGGLQSLGSRRVGHDQATGTLTFIDLTYGDSL